MTETKNTIAIIIPALNEELAIESTLQAIPIEATIVVVDNGSTDNTATIASKYATVVSEINKGYGFACLKGIDYLKTLNPPPKLVIFLDADGADDPSELMKLLEIKENIPYPDLVLGSRLDKLEMGAMAKHAIWANKVFTKIIKLLYKVKLSDMGPMRVIDYQTLLDIDMQDTGYGWTSEMIVKAIKRGYTLVEVPVTYRKRIGVSKISGSWITSLRAALWITIHIIKHAWRK
ncbi:MAG: glycosyltransferase family 2 protein [Candidatus Heimdallarchaeota archaeon]|nr:glycosyltransferase family 2 protein [Candidatus Heimdallarchaeota archaeon]